MNKETKKRLAQMSEVKVWKVSLRDDAGAWEDMYFSKPGSANKHYGTIPETRTKVAPLEVIACKEATEYFILSGNTFTPISVLRW